MRLSRAAVFLPLGTLVAGASAHETGVALADPWRTWGGPWWLYLLLALAAWLAARGVWTLWRRAGVGAGVKRWEAASFAGGWVVLALSILSPLDAFGGQLFWAHMVQHELLMLAAAPLLVLSRPLATTVWGLPHAARPLAARLAGSLGLVAALRVLSRPLTAWLLHAAVLWGWHAPALFEAALHVPWVHDLQHACFFASALLFWWALLTGPKARLGLGVLYLFTTMVHTSLLGALLTFSGRVLYASYEGTAPRWGLSALEDQQLGGLIMWVPGGVVYLLAGLGLMAAWLAQPRHAAMVGRPP